MSAPRSLVLSLAPSVGLVLSLGVAGCAKGSGPTVEPTAETAPTAEPAAAEPAAAEPTAEPVPGGPVVRNVDAQPGDVTTCPYSGRTFVVKADHPKVEYGGQSYWICSEKAAAAVRDDPGKYLDGFQG